MSIPSFSLSAGRTRVDVVCPPGTANILRAVWAPATASIVPTEAHETWRCSPSSEAWALETPRGRRRARTQSELAAVVESELISQLTLWHPSDSLLHGAFFELGGLPFVVLGESGAGKSSLSLEAVRRGATYHSDEIVITDGARVWGVGRSLVYDLCAPDAPMPDWLSGADRTTYQLELAGRGLVARPIIQVPSGQWARAPARASDVIVVHVGGRADQTTVTPLTGGEALATLFDAATTERRGALARLASGRRALRVRWKTPSDGLTQVLAATTRAPTSGGDPSPRGG